MHIYEWRCRALEGLVMASSYDPLDALLGSVLDALLADLAALEYRPTGYDDEEWRTASDEIDASDMDVYFVAQLGLDRRVKRAAARQELHLPYEATDPEAGKYFTSAILRGAVPTFEDLRMGLDAQFLTSVQTADSPRPGLGVDVPDKVTAKRFADECQRLRAVLDALRDAAVAAQGASD